MCACKWHNLAYSVKGVFFLHILTTRQVYYSIQLDYIKDLAHNMFNSKYKTLHDFEAYLRDDVKK